MNSILEGCDPILTMKDAELPVVTPLLPVKGLRRTDKGDLTDDAISTVMEGIKSLWSQSEQAQSMGIQLDSQAAKDALLQEAKTVLCRLNAQYEFLLTMLFTSISRSETVNKELIDSLRSKNQSMQDVLSVSRHVMNRPPADDKMVEGFLDTRFEPTRSKMREAFQTIANTVAERDNLLEAGDYNELKNRGLEITEERNTYANNMIGLYGILNVVAVGLLFYVMSS
jgi:hypothetical protein